MLSKAYGGEGMKKKSNFFEWHEQFKEGCKIMEDDKRSGHPKMS
jgi:hypothetical protein